MNDLLPERSPVWQFVEETLKGVLASYGYEEIRTPLLEKTELFKRSIGEVTDIVEKEMYTFADRNGDQLTLRPEGTAGCVRAMVENGLLRGANLRLWYLGAMFRHERPQKGRYRQFHQLGVETFGFPGPDMDAELILLSARMLKALGLGEVQLEINSLGTPACRVRYREDLVAYLTHHQAELDEDSQRRLVSNPLRVLDSKNPAMQTLIANAPRLGDYLDEESQNHFATLLATLTGAGVDYQINHRLVRGLDYYSRTVFEWVSNQLGAQGTVCAGGRFDGLVEQLGGAATPAMGFALGLERLVALLEERGAPPIAPPLHGYLVHGGADSVAAALALAEQLRDGLPGLRLKVHCGGGGLKAQFRHADKSAARFALVLGEGERAQGQITLKDLRGDQPQQVVAQEALLTLLAEYIPELAVASFPPLRN